MGFSTKECAWSQTNLKILGRTAVGIAGFDFEKDVETEYLYGAGDEPIDIQRGNKGYPGSVDLLKYELDMLNDAALAAGYEDITEVPHEAIVITCIFKKLATDTPRTITAAACAFSNIKLAMQQNDKSMKVTLPFKSMKTSIK
jgi:hypothetical protein